MRLARTPVPNGTSFVSGDTSPGSTPRGCKERVPVIEDWWKDVDGAWYVAFDKWIRKVDRTAVRWCLDRLDILIDRPRIRRERR